MKDKLKDSFKVIMTIIGFILIMLWYPWFVSVENGEARCHNIFGITMKCR